MKTVKVSIVLCIMLGFIIESAEAQISQKSNLKTERGRQSELNVNTDTAFRRVNASVYSNLDFFIPRRLDLTVQKDLTITVPDIDYYSLLYNSSFFGNKWAAFILKPVVPENKITDIAANNRSGLILNSPAGVNAFSHAKKSIKPSFSDNILYRISGEVFNASSRAAYPSLSAPKK